MYIFCFETYILIYSGIDIEPQEKREVCKIVKAKKTPFEPVFRMEEKPLPIEEQKTGTEETLGKVSSDFTKIQNLIGYKTCSM